MRLALSALLLAVAASGPLRAAPPAAPAADKPPTGLTEYVGKADKSFAWKLKEKAENNGHTTYLLSLTSQTWQGLDWQHDLQVFVPKGCKPQATMVLWNQGGNAGATSTALGTLIAEKVGAPIAFLYGIPKQPLYKDAKGNLTTVPPNPKNDKEGRLVEDALIAQTFVKYLETKDESWPLLFPMVKGVVRAMDALQAFTRDELKVEAKQFVITGASKRGWTSWLTAASGDKRVKAIAPLVIDTLNMPVQMENQLRAFGDFSEMIGDYKRARLIPFQDTPEAKKLWRMIDPYVYRDGITVPKMLIHGTNDPYWPQDALNTYWDDLKGDKAVCYVPNAGHDLREADEKGNKELIPTRAVNTLAAFGRCQVFDKPLPKMKWEVKKTGFEFEKGGDLPEKLRVWTANSDTLDFRKARWRSEESGPPAVKDGGTIAAFLAPKGFTATYVECEFKTDAGPVHLCTQIQIHEAKK